MTPSDPKRSKDTTTPRGNPVPAPAEKPQKAEKKLEPTVIVAIISAIVTLITAFLSSPVLLALVNNPAATDAPSGGEMGLVGPLMPGNAQSTPTEGLVKATSEVTGITPLAIIVSTTPRAGNATPTATVNNPTATLAPENTAVPTVASVIPTEPPASTLLTCFAVDDWFPYPATLNPGVSNGCWNLADWGFTAAGEQLLLVHNPGQDQQRGIYLPISGDAEIQFTIQLNEFRVKGNKGGFLHFGIVQNDPFNNFAGGFLSYQQPSPGTGSPVRALVSGTNQATETVLILEKGFQQAVRLSVVGDILTVFLDGTPSGNPIALTPTDRAFWIGYVLPGKAELDVSLIGLTIQSP